MLLIFILLLDVVLLLNTYSEMARTNNQGVYGVNGSATMATVVSVAILRY